MSSAERAVASRRTSAGLARTQPIRRPAQNVLLIEPMVITVSPSGSSAATGAGGSAPSRCSPATASSITSGVRVVRASATSRSRSAAGSVSPVGFWWSAITYASRGAAWRSVAASISRSQPSGSIGTGTGRAPTARTASSAAG